MSAYLVGNITINKILTRADAEIKLSNNLKARFEKVLGIDCTVHDWKTRLGQRMVDLNQLALGHRYGDLEKTVVYKFQVADCSQIEAFKALQCWLYQCMEGDIPEQSSLFKFFKKFVIPNWAISFVMRSSDYDRAEWG
jgi:hypothetical protein